VDISRRQLLAWAGAAGGATLVGGVSTATGAPVHQALAVRRRFPGDPGPGRLYYGCSMPYYKDFGAWESWLGRALASHRHYHQPGEISDLGAEAAGDLRRGRMPHTSIKSPGRWQDVARGGYDGWLNRLLDRVGALPGPVFLTLHHEPENDISRFGMQPRHWVAMQERAIAKAARRAPNVTIVPVLMGYTFDPRSRRHPEHWMVPSAKVFGFDTYNSWSPTNGKKWSSFASKVERIRPWAKGRPLVVGEYGCRADPSDPGRAAQWMRDAFAYALNHNIVCMSYFNSRQNSPEGSWELDGRRAEVFRRLLARAEVARP
jgi:TAT (twin-arginine translocation) pathway signal sequence